MFFSAISVYPQQFNSLDGIEDEQGSTQLLYRLGDQFYIYNPVYKFNTNNFQESLLIQAYYYNFPGGDLAKAVLDFEFFPNDESNFMNVGSEINPDNHSYIARNDTIIFGGFNGFTGVDNSKQNPLKVFVFGGGGPVRSWDGGYTFPLDSIPAVTNFIPISLADFDDNILFGINEDQQLAKNGEIVDTSKFYFDQYSKFLYDVNELHIYRINRTIGGYSLSVSNSKGDVNTWDQRTYPSVDPIFLTIDSTQSGLLYLADGRIIYKSDNNGYTITPYKTLQHKIIGIYKKPNSEIIYAASKSRIFKVTPDSVSIIKSLPISEEEYGWFPLAIGNRWAYDSYSIEGISHHFMGNKYMSVVKDTLIETKKYFVVENYDLPAVILKPKMFLRVDSLTGFIYQYWQELDSEYIFHDLNAEIGDTILNPTYSNQPFYILEYEQPINYLGVDTYERMYFENLPCTCNHTLIKGFGLGSTLFWEFGGSESILKNCLINGILYGDTTFAVDVEEEQNPIPTKYKLEQNYPNPFNSVTKIKYSIPSVISTEGRNLKVTLRVYDVLGREVATLVDEYRNAGSYDVNFDASKLSSGVYYYQLNAGNFLETKSMILIK